MKHESHASGFLGMDNQPLIIYSISVGCMPAVPQPFLSPLKHLVPRSIRSHLAFKLSEIQKDVAEQAAHRILSIQALSHGYELNGVAIKQIHQHMEIFHRTGQPIYLVGQYAIQPSFSDIAEHF